MDYIEEKLEIYNPEDWYGYTSAQIFAFHGNPMVAYAGGMFKLLKLLYPNHNWNQSKFNEVMGSKAQLFLYRTVREIIGQDEEIEYNRHSTLLKYMDTQLPMQLDIWIPKHNLVLEYQVINYINPSFSRIILLLYFSY
jgi:hypothetical protein